MKVSEFIYSTSKKKSSELKKEKTITNPKMMIQNNLNCPIEKEEAIKDAFRHFQLI